MDQPSSTIHGTMKFSFFGQPPCQNIFPGVCGTRIMEQDLENVMMSNNQYFSSSKLILKLSEFDPETLSKVDTDPSSNVDSDHLTDASCIPPPDVVSNVILHQILR